MKKRDLGVNAFTGPALVLVFLGLFAAVLSVTVARASGKKEEAGINCDVHKGPCTQSLGDCTVTLDIRPKPVRAMKDLTFSVKISGKPSVAAPFIDLGMPGMDMGPNRVHLSPVKGDTYEGTGVIVRCPSGRRTWKATLTVPGSGKAGFIFDVIY